MSEIDRPTSKTNNNKTNITLLHADGTATYKETIPIWYIRSKNAIYYALGVIEVLLVLRFIFMILGANAGSGFTVFLYAVSGILVAPFSNIFNPLTASGLVSRSVFDPAAIVAMIIYALAAWGLVKLLWVKVSKNGHE